MPGCRRVRLCYQKPDRTNKRQSTVFSFRLRQKHVLGDLERENSTGRSTTINGYSQKNWKAGNQNTAAVSLDVRSEKRWYSMFSRRYWLVNNIKIRNRTPLPLVVKPGTGFMASIGSRCLMSEVHTPLFKFRKGDECEAAFQTKFGLSEYTAAMPFGLWIQYIYLSAWFIVFSEAFWIHLLSKTSTIP